MFLRVCKIFIGEVAPQTILILELKKDSPWVIFCVLSNLDESLPKSAYILPLIVQESREPSRMYVADILQTRMVILLWS